MNDWKEKKRHTENNSIPILRSRTLQRTVISSTPPHLLKEGIIVITRHGLPVELRKGTLLLLFFITPRLHVNLLVRLLR